MGFGALTVGAHIEPVAVGAAVAAAAVGALAPDLDHPGSLASFGIPTALIAYGGGFLVALAIQNRMTGPQIFDLSTLGTGFVPAAWTAIVVGVALLVLSFAAGAAFGHRGPVHSIAFGLIATAVVAVGLVIFRAPLWLALPFAWGWITHLVADATTKMGLPSLLWPLDRERMSLHEASLSAGTNAQTVSTRAPEAARGVADARAAAETIAPVCPKCGIPMVVRTASRGENQGRQFYGCVNFPRCRQTSQIG